MESLLIDYNKKTADDKFAIVVEKANNIIKDYKGPEINVLKLQQYAMWTVFLCDESIYKLYKK